MTRARELWKGSATAWVDFAKRDPHRLGILDPRMKALAGPGNGACCLDVGCGQGRYMSMLRKQGWQPIGLDPTEHLVRLARNAGSTVLAEGERIPFADDSFSMVCSYVSLVDVEGVEECMRELARVLKPMGRLIVANLNAFATASEYGWHRDEVGNKRFMPVDRYFEKRAIEVEWRGMRLINFHRPLQTYMQGFLSAGLRLLHFEECTPEPEATSQFPEIADNLRVPYFHIMVWQKN